MTSTKSTSNQLPFPRSYWVEPGKFLAGAYPGSQDIFEARDKMAGLIECGIRRIINLMEPDEADHRRKPFTPMTEFFVKSGPKKEWTFLW